MKSKRDCLLPALGNYVKSPSSCLVLFFWKARPRGSKRYRSPRSRETIIISHSHSRESHPRLLQLQWSFFPRSFPISDFYILRFVPFFSFSHRTLLPLARPNDYSKSKWLLIHKKTSIELFLDIVRTKTTLFIMPLPPPPLASSGSSETSSISGTSSLFTCHDQPERAGSIAENLSSTCCLARRWVLAGQHTLHGNWIWRW